MKKIAYILLILFGFVTSLWGQNHTIAHEGAVFKLKRRQHLKQFTGSDEQHHYFLYQNGKQHVLKRLTKDLKERITLPVPMSYKGKKMVFEGIYMVKDHFILLSSFANQKIQRHFLFARKWHKDSLNQLGSLQKVAEISFEKNTFHGSFITSLSPDFNKIVILSLQQLEYNSPYKYGIHVIDHELQSVWERSIASSYWHAPISIEQFLIDDEANVFILGHTFKVNTGFDFQDSKPQDFYLIRYSELGTLHKDFKYDCEGEYLQDMHLQLNKDNTLVGVGLLGKDISSLSSSIFLKFKASDNRLWLKKSPVTFENVPISEQINASKHYQIRHLYTNKNKLTHCALEQVLVNYSRKPVLDPNAQSTTRATKYFHYNHLLFLTFNDEGNMEQSVHISKKQRSVNDQGYYSSFTLIHNQETSSVLFNDTKNDSTSYSKKWNPVMVSIHSGGKTDKRELTLQNSEELIFRPKASFQISKKSLLYYSIKRSREMFSQIDIQ